MSRFVIMTSIIAGVLSASGQAQAAPISFVAGLFGGDVPLIVDAPSVDLTELVEQGGSITLANSPLVAEDYPNGYETSITNLTFLVSVSGGGAAAPPGGYQTLIVDGSLKGA